jgi:hypothetical protein
VPERVFMRGFASTLKKIYFAIILVVAITISSIVAYSYTMPKTQTEIEIDYSPAYQANALVKFHDQFYMRGSAMHIIKDPHQQSIHLRKGDSLVLKLLSYPSNVTGE